MASWTEYLPLATMVYQTFFAGWILRRQARANQIAEERAEAESYAKTESLIRGWIGTMRNTHPDLTVRAVLDECVRRLMEENEPPIKRGAANNAVANVQWSLALPVGKDAETMLIGEFKPVNPPNLGK